MTILTLCNCNFNAFTVQTLQMLYVDSEVQRGNMCSQETRVTPCSGTELPSAHFYCSVQPCPVQVPWADLEQMLAFLKLSLLSSTVLGKNIFPLMKTYLMGSQWKYFVFGHKKIRWLLWGSTDCEKLGANIRAAVMPEKSSHQMW